MNRDEWKLPLGVLGGVIGAAIFVHYQPHTPGDVAAWVQAVGSIAAIYAAFRVASNQTRETLRREASDQKNAYETVVEIFDQLVDPVIRYVKLVLDENRGLDDVDVKRAERDFTYAFSVWQTYPIANLQYAELVRRYTIARGIVMDNVYLIGNIDNMNALPDGRERLREAVRRLQIMSSELHSLEPWK